MVKNNNGYKEKYIEEKFDVISSDVREIRKSIKVLNDHSGEVVIRLTKIEDKVDPIQKIVYGIIGLVLTLVLTAILLLVLR